GAFIKYVDLTGSAETVTNPVPSFFSRINADSTWVLAALGDPFATVQVTLYRADPFTEYPLIINPSSDAALDFTWSPDGRRFALYGGEANTISVWEITND